MPTTDLTNTNISDTYQGMLHFRGEQLPATGQVDVFDGIGNKTSIKIGRACNGVTICGPFKCDNIVIGDWAITKKSVVDLIYPVGSVIYSTLATSPATRFPGTVWNQIASGRFIVGVGTGVDDRGEYKNFAARNAFGEYNHRLTEPEMPSHTHQTVIPYSNESGTSGDPWGSGNSNRKFEGNYTFTPTYAGGNLAHNNTPPAYGLYVFERTQ